MRKRWTADVVDSVIARLRESKSVADAASSLDLTVDQVRQAFRSAGYPPPGMFVSGKNGETIGDTVPAPASLDGLRTGPGIASVGASIGRRAASTDVDTLVQATRTGARGFEELCDRLQWHPGRLRAAISAAKSQGRTIDVAGDVIGWREPEPVSDAVDIGVPPTVGGRRLIAAISDTHFGSKYCLREQLIDFLTYAYERGARHVLHSGDMLDGCYDHGRWELSHHGVHEQTEDMLATLPQLDGLTYHAIGGNHDDTFRAHTGLETGRLIEDEFARAGRTDFRYHGLRRALLLLDGVRVELWHPTGGKAYSLTYKLQNYIRDLPLGHKPDIVLAGHWHVSGHLEQRGVHAYNVPCWQGGGSAFGRSLGGAPSIGGLLISWERTHHGTIRRLACERSAYYEREQPRDIGGA